MQRNFQFPASIAFWLVACARIKLLGSQILLLGGVCGLKLYIENIVVLLFKFFFICYNSQIWKRLTSFHNFL